MTDRLAGRVAFITGAARGQGRAHAVRMADEGADIIAVDIAGQAAAVRALRPRDTRRPSRDRPTGRGDRSAHPRLGGGHPRLRRRCTRPSTPASTDLGRLDVIVANAGHRAPQVWDEITPDDFRDVMDDQRDRHLEHRDGRRQHIIDGGRGGSIILISSAAGIKMQPFMIHYTASKHAVTGMARAFAAELGKHTIRVNSVHPGPVNRHGFGRHDRRPARPGEQSQLAHMGTPIMPPG